MPELGSLEKKMILAQSGDSEAYASVLKEISHKIRGYLLKRVSTADDAEDILQEVLISIHKARHTFDPSRQLMPWVMAIVKFRLSDYLRTYYKNVCKDSVDINELEEKLSEDVTFDSDSGELLNIAMDSLPSKQRQVVYLMKIEGYTAIEVGEKLGMSVSAVKVTAHRAYKKLKIKLEEIGHEN